MKAIQGYLWGFLFMLIPALSYSQQSDSPSEQAEQKRPAYLEMEMGLSLSSFRDYATSPLIYSGKPIHLGLGLLELSNLRESSIRFSYAFGNYRNRFNEQTTLSKVDVIDVSYVELYRIGAWSTDRFNLKVGGQWTTTTNVRQNTALQNNGTGVEIVSNLFGTAKGSLNLSESQALSITMNLGLLNAAYRNGFVYVGQSAPTNQGSIFDQYELSLVSGYRFITQVDYTLKLKNENALRFSYNWDAYQTRGNYDEFEMASHLFKVALLFNLR